VSVKNQLLKLAVRSVGRLSDGIDLSLRYGLVSGKMLDYVYRNQPSGRGFVGKWIDGVYLRHRGWETVRMRKRHLETMLDHAIGVCLRDHGEARVVDIASGPARYILDTLDRYRGQAVTAMCRDIDERWIEEGRARARDIGLTCVSFEKGDAFDESYAPSPAPTIIVASGFYDWIADDDLVRRSMSIAHASLKPGGFFLFTNQSGHVDLSMANEVFTGLGGKPLQMTTRAAEAMNSWAAAIGYLVEQACSDPWGDYTVTLARKAR
jgi:SAM-dependent methyltransferase